MNKKNLRIFVVFALAFFLRVVSYVALGRLTHPIFWEYHDIAENFLHGKGLACPFLDKLNYAYAEPFYPTLSAVTYYLTNHNYVIFGVINMLASGLIAVVVYYLGKELFDERVGMVAAILTAIHPGLIYFSTQFHPLTFNALFTVLFALTGVKLLKSINAREAIICGLVIGCAFLDRFSCLIFIPIILGAVIFSNGTIRQKLKICTIVGLVAIIPVAGWVTRNYIVLHKPVVARSSAGYLLWIGNNPKATNSASYNYTTPMIDTLGKEAVEKIKNMDELEINDYLMGEAVSFIKSHPKVFLSGWAKRFYYFWWFSPLEGMRYPHAWLILYKAFYTFILLTALYAVVYMFINRKRNIDVYLPGIYFVVISVLVLAVAQTLFYVEGRHRWVVEPVLMIFSSWTIVYAVVFLKKGSDYYGRVQ